MYTETGGLFRLITRLMVQKVPQKKISSLDALVSYLGKYFQIRDDYMNLTPEVFPPPPSTPTPSHLISNLTKINSIPHKKASAQISPKANSPSL